MTLKVTDNCSIDFCEPHILTGLPSDTPLLLAFSGGADSRALLHLLAAYAKENRAELHVAHVDHGIRGEEAKRDREFCLKTAESYGIECHLHCANVPEIAAQSGEGIEAAARRVRYDFFASLMQQLHIQVLVTAHNADDNLETLLLNITRGSGLRGLGAIPPVRDFGDGLVIRPLLGATKAEITAYCESEGLEFVTDSTNSDQKYSRNLIRHTVTPALEQINPALLRNVSRLCESVRRDSEFINLAVIDYFSSKGKDANKLSELNILHPALRPRVIAKMYSSVSDGGVLEEVHLEDIGNICLKGANGLAVSLPGLIRAEIKDKRLVFVSDPRKEFRHL